MILLIQARISLWCQGTLVTHIHLAVNHDLKCLFRTVDSQPIWLQRFPPSHVHDCVTHVHILFEFHNFPVESIRLTYISFSGR